MEIGTEIDWDIVYLGKSETIDATITGHYKYNDSARFEIDIKGNRRFMKVVKELANPKKYVDESIRIVQGRADHHGTISNILLRAYDLEGKLIADNYTEPSNGKH